MPAEPTEPWARESRATGDGRRATGDGRRATGDGLTVTAGVGASLLDERFGPGRPPAGPAAADARVPRRDDGLRPSWCHGDLDGRSPQGIRRRSDAFCLAATTVHTAVRSAR